MRAMFDWQPYHSEQLPLSWRDWLSIRGSLTNALEEKGGRPCIVTIEREGYDYPSLEERAFLSLKNDGLHWVREVILSQHEPLVKARSVFPCALIDSCPEFSQLGTQALGRLLFSNDLAIYRGEIQVAKLDNGLWARRSRFHVREHQLLVCEVFLDAVASL